MKLWIISANLTEPIVRIYERAHKGTNISVLDTLIYKTIRQCEFIIDAYKIVCIN